MKTINNPLLSHCLDNFIQYEIPVFQADCSYFAKDIIQSKETYNYFFSFAQKQQKIAIQFQDSYLLSLFILFLDGLADVVLILPADASRELASSFCEKLTISNIITDQDSLDRNAITVHHLNGRKGISENELVPSPTSTTWIIPTSGTTGTPKLIPNTTYSLIRTLIRDPAKGRNYRWGNLYDLSRFAGLQVFLQAIVGGSTLILNDDKSIKAKLQALIEHKCNALSGTPTIWRKILMMPEADQLALKQITLGGEIVDQVILEALKKRFPTAKITHIYASTEAGVGFSVTDGKAGFPKSFVQASPLKSDIKVSSEGILLLRPSGESRQLLQMNDERLVDEEGFVVTGDVLGECEDRYVFLGRSSGSINVGGQKVHPEEIEQVLLSFNGVEGAKVFGKKSSFMGYLVAAEIVINKAFDADDLKAKLREYCARHLPKYKVPVDFKIVDQITSNYLGKIDRRSY